MIIIILILLGLCFGSFVNAAVYRLRMQSVKSKTKNVDYSIVHGRSICVNCHHTLAWYDLVPVISWLSLTGRCRYCKKPISAQYPLVEVTTAALFVLSYLVWPYDFGVLGVTLFSFWLVFLLSFMALVIYDLRWMILPNSIVFPLVGLAVLQIILHAVMASDFGIVLGAVMGLMSTGGLFYILFQVSNGKWIGGGDVKLGFVLGMLAGGFIEGLLVIFIASLLGTIIAIPLLGFSKKNLSKRIPFGPFLIVACIIVYLFSSDFIGWFQNQSFLL